MLLRGELRFFDGRGFFAKRLGLDPEPVKVAEGFPRKVVLLPDRGGWFVFHDGSGELRAALDVPADRIAVVQAVADQNFPLLATSSRAAIAVWQEGDSRRAAVVSSTGSSRPLDLRASQVAFDGKEFVAIDGAGFGLAFSAQFFSAEGEPVTEPVSFGSGHTAVWSGSRFFVFEWHYVNPRSQFLTMQRYTRSGVAVDPVPVTIYRDQFADIDAVVSNGKYVFLLFQNLQLGRIDADGAVLIGPEKAPYLATQMAAGEDDIFVMSGDEVMAYTADLRPRWSEPLSVSRDVFARPSIAAEGDVATIVWREPTQIAGARVTRDGVVDPFVVLETTAPAAAVRVSTGGGTTVVGYVRAAPEAPYFGALRYFTQWSTPTRRHAAGH